MTDNKTNMLIKESPCQINNDNSRDCEEKVIYFNPRPQRVWKMNRRGFYLANSAKLGLKDPSNLTRSENEGKSRVSSICDPSKESLTTNSSITTSKKVIKLNSSSKFSVNSSVTLNNRKRSFSENKPNGVTKVPEDPPDKKKHKVITWP